MKYLAPILALCCTILAVSVASADPLFTLTNTTAGQLGNGPFNLGFSFTTSNAAFVTSLGVFDSDLDGLVENHAIGLFANDGTLLASSTVLSGTVDPLINQFRYVNIAPVLLAAGQTYLIGAVYNSDTDGIIFPGLATDFSTTTGITFDQNRYLVGGTLTAPTNSGGDSPGYFGPNAIITDVPVTGVPDTGSTLALLGLGLGSLALARHKLRLA